MASTMMGAARDQLYAQWQEDVRQARKARRGDIELKSAGELAQVEAQNAGALERLQREGDSTMAVAKLKTGAERELEQMRIGASSDELGRKIGSEEGMLATREQGLMARLLAEEKAGSYKDRMATVAETQVGLKNQAQAGYTVDELANFLHTATHDKEGKAIPISDSDKSAMNLMARQSGYRVRENPGMAYTAFNPKFWMNPSTSKTTGKPVDITDKDWWVNSQVKVPGSESYSLEADPDSVAAPTLKKRKPGIMK